MKHSKQKKYTIPAIPKHVKEVKTNAAIPQKTVPQKEVLATKEVIITEEVIQRDATAAAAAVEIEEQIDAFMNAWFVTRQFVMEANFHRAHLHGMSTTQFMLLARLMDGSVWTLVELAVVLNLETPTLVRTVDSLEQRGLVMRQRNTVDRRQVLITITTAGLEVQAAAVEQFRTRLTTIFQTMLPIERDALILGLAAFARSSRPNQPEVNQV
ncbi:MarR family transcriptional regulator [Ktedonobacteria bacterium brp13]|nr:MarR family transcriptional regulator [Ktedonobacteria bacterium brp13]